MAKVIDKLIFEFLTIKGLVYSFKYSKIAIWNSPNKPDGKLSYKNVVNCHDDKRTKNL